MSDVSPPDAAGSSAASVPTATVLPPRRLSPVWLVPLLALALSGWLGYRWWSLRGLTVTVELERGHGLRPGDEVRYRGITVGEVREVRLAEDLGSVEAAVRLWARPEELARSGSRFWVVRPRLGAGEVAGLETLVGPRYLAMLPGQGPRQRRFVGLGDPPPVETIEPGDLEIIVHAPSRGDLRAGAPVTYRQVRIGTVLSVGLTSDAGAVEARLHVEKPYAQLIRRESRFWRIGGVRASLGLTGASFELDSLEAVLTGGVAVATPPGLSPLAITGHRFQLATGPEEEWADWEPMVVIGSELLPPGAPRPAPQRATIGWRQGRLFKGQRSRQGWVLQTDRGVLGPADLLIPAPDAEPGTVILEVAGERVPLGPGPLWRRGRLARLDLEVAGAPWPDELMRPAAEPEDCIVVGDHAAAPFPLAASRLTTTDDDWKVDPAVALDDSWHGACVLARSDGRLLGLLIVYEERILVALLPPESDEATKRRSD